MFLVLSGFGVLWFVDHKSAALLRAPLAYTRIMSVFDIEVPNPIEKYLFWGT